MNLAHKTHARAYSCWIDYFTILPARPRDPIPPTLKAEVPLRPTNACGFGLNQAEAV